MVAQGRFDTPDTPRPACEVKFGPAAPGRRDGRSRANHACPLNMQVGRHFFRADREDPRAAAGPADDCPDRCPDNMILGHILRLCTGKQGGVGLDFVRERGYGRCRWLKYPAQAKKQ